MSIRSSRQLCALSRTPTWKPTSSFLPSEVALMITSMHLATGSTDAVLDEVTECQERPFEPVYPLVAFDALRVKARDEGTVRNKAVHVALGVRADGTKEVLGPWIEQGARYTSCLPTAPTLALSIGPLQVQEPAQEACHPHQSRPGSAIVEAIDAFTRAECHSYFATAGYNCDRDQTDDLISTCKYHHCFFRL